MQPNSKLIDDLKRQIVSLIHPLKIIIFGSAARGDFKEGSDVDILVVVPQGMHRRHTCQELYRKISGVKTPFDILVATPQDLQEHKDNIGLIYHTILREGKEIYAAP